MPCRNFRGVNNVIAREGVDGHYRQRAIHQHVVGGRGTVANAVGDAGSHGVVRFAKRAHRRRRYANAPVTAGIGGGGVVDAVQGHRDSGAIRLITGAREQQIFAFLSGIDHIIRCQDIDADLRRHGVNDNVQRIAASIAGLVRYGDINRQGTVGQPLNNRCWQTETPVAHRVYHSGVVDVIDGDGDQITRCCAGDGAAEDLRLRMGDLVNGIGIGDKIVDRHLRHGGIHQPHAIGATAVARHIAHSSRDRHRTIYQRAYVGGRYIEGPGSVRLDGGLVRFTVQRHGNSLSRLGITGAADRQILLRFRRIDDVIGRQVVHRDSRWQRIHGDDARGFCAIAVHIGDTDAHLRTSVDQGFHCARRNGQAPGTILLHLRSKGLVGKFNHHGLTGFHTLRLT